MTWLRPSLSGVSSWPAPAPLTAPTVLALEVVNALGRRWGWAAGELHQAAVTFDEPGLNPIDPALTRLPTG